MVSVRVFDTFHRRKFLFAHTNYLLAPPTLRFFRFAQKTPLRPRWREQTFQTRDFFFLTFLVSVRISSTNTYLKWLCLCVSSDKGLIFFPCPGFRSDWFNIYILKVIVYMCKFLLGTNFFSLSRFPFRLVQHIHSWSYCVYV